MNTRKSTLVPVIKLYTYYLLQPKRPLETDTVFSLPWEFIGCSTTQQRVDYKICKFSYHTWGPVWHIVTRCPFLRCVFVSHSPTAKLESHRLSSVRDSLPVILEMLVAMQLGVSTQVKMVHRLLRLITLGLAPSRARLGSPLISPVYGFVTNRGGGRPLTALEQDA